MWCPSCAWIVEEVLRRTRGVVEPQVSFLADMVHLRYLPHRVSPQEILDAVSRLGFRPALFEDEPAASAERRSRAVRLGVSAILTANIMMISMALYFGFFEDLSPRVIGYLSYPAWGMATAVVFYGGLPILRRGWAAIRYRRPSMDTLIAVGAMSAYAYSCLQMAAGSVHVYFDTAAMLVTFVLLGRSIEDYARSRVVSGIEDLHRLTRQKVRRWNPFAGGKEEWELPANIRPGDDFLVFAGERVPLDGRVVSGEVDVDESVLTGEAAPVKKLAGDEILGGVRVLRGEAQVRTTRVGPQSSLGQVIALLQEALRKKNPAELAADRVTRWFVPVILAAAALTAGGLLLRGFSFDEALLRSLAVLLISCPCALGIATPIVKIAVMSRARKRGLVIRDPGALERARNLDTFVFDKTGTLTQGDFSLLKTVAFGAPEKDVLARLAAVEASADHFLAREIGRRAREMSVDGEEAVDFEALEGLGVKGTWRGESIFIGNRRLLAREGIEVSEALEGEAGASEERGMTVVFFGWEKVLRGMLVFGDPVRPGMGEMVRTLQDRGCAVWIVSGDAEKTTRAVAREVGVENFLAQALPQDKRDFIESLQRTGRCVAMVGDGVNDAAALAQADVGFALGAATQIHRDASDFTFPGQNPMKLLEALSLSAAAVKAIRQNLFFAFLYNSIGIPLAIAGLMNPLGAVAAMFASSLTVIGNALRVSREKENDHGEKAFSEKGQKLVKEVQCPESEVR